LSLYVFPCSWLAAIRWAPSFCFYRRTIGQLLLLTLPGSICQHSGRGIRLELQSSAAIQQFNKASNWGVWWSCFLDASTVVSSEICPTTFPIQANFYFVQHSGQAQASFCFSCYRKSSKLH
jgi:hypothetical protein